MNKTVTISKNDNVMIALVNISRGEIVNGITVLDDITFGHKIALVNISKGEKIVKYGNPIGTATKDILAGQWVHTFNITTNLSDKLEYVYNKQKVEEKVNKPIKKVSVYPRSNGEFGIRNEIWIIPTVGCVNSQAKQICEKYIARYGISGFDGVTAITHPYGCSQLGDDFEFTRNILVNLVKHPNAGGALVLGLGCESNQMKGFIEKLGEFDSNRVKFLIAQEVEDEISEGIKLVDDIAKVISNDKRVEKDISVINVGLKCGGSDGLSGITANPIVGRFSDYLIESGGSCVLTEVPEMFGAESLLMARAKDKSVFDKTVGLINDFKDYFIDNGQVVYENPSPGNKAGGITTLEDKSIGCTQKSGSCEVSNVLKNGQRISTKGLNLLDGPGNDMVAVTNLTACGCQLVLFTTGRGTPFGGIVPTVKIATNNTLATKKSNWIDFDASKCLTDGFETVTDELIDYVVQVANGKQTSNEKTNSKEIAIFKNGVTL